MLSAGYVAVALAFVRLAFATFPEHIHSEDSSHPSIRENIATLFEKFQSDPAYYDFYTIVQTNPIPWKSYTGYFEATLLKKYIDRFESMDFDSFIDSYKECRKAGELEIWLNNLKHIQFHKKLEYNIISCSLQTNCICIDGMTQDELKTISNCIAIGITTNLVDLIGQFGLECDRYAAFGPYRIALIRLLASKKYLMGMLKHALIVPLPGTAARFIDQIIPMLDGVTRRAFLDFLANAGGKCCGPFNMASLSSFNYKPSVKHQVVETMSNFAPSPAAALLFAVDDLIAIVLSHLDWKTLMQSVPSVSKRFNNIATKSFLIQHSLDLELYTRQQSIILSPFHMILMYPWSCLFPSSHQLIKYYALKCQKNGLDLEKNWLISVHQGLCESEESDRVSDEYPDNNLLKRSIKADLQSRYGLTFGENLSKDNILRLTDIFLEASEAEDKALDKVYSALHHAFHEKHGDKLIYLLRNTKYSEKFFRLARKHKEFLGFFDYAIAAILVLDNLNMPYKVTDAVKKYVSETFGKKVSVPMTAEQRRANHSEYPDILSKPNLYEKSQLACEILIKILSYHADNHSIEAWTGILNSPFIASKIRQTLMSDPKVMPLEQFKLFIGIAPPIVLNFMSEGLKSALRIKT